MADSPPGPRREQDERIREEVSALPATFIDGWFTTTWRGHIRIVISEKMYDIDRWRYAFILEWDDAEKFAAHILKAIADWKSHNKDDEENGDSRS
jgi:hypothetical protein